MRGKGVQYLSQIGVEWLREGGQDGGTDALLRVCQSDGDQGTKHVIDELGVLILQGQQLRDRIAQDGVLCRR